MGSPVPNALRRQELSFVTIPDRKVLSPWSISESLDAEVPHAETNSSAFTAASSRVKTPEGVWVFWTCGGRDETSRVRNLSAGGLFIETGRPRAVGAEAHVEFLVQEGQIRAEGVVRHVETGSGLGLKFTAINDKDHPRMVSLINRLRSLPDKFVLET